MLLTKNDLDWFFRPSIGQKEVQRYPLTDLGVDENDNLRINVAVAGFSKEDIMIEVKGNQLHIIGTQTERNEHIEYIQKHLSSSDFKRVVVLHENYVNGDIDANLENGVLKIIVKPKEALRKMIEIKTDQKLLSN